MEAAWERNLKSSIREALKTFAPPEKLTVSEWCDKYRVLGRDESSFSGQWVTDNTPYLRKIMDTFTDDTTQIVAFLKPTQVGATEAGINICAYTIGADPSRILYIMPDDDLAKDFSTDRLQKAFRNCPAVAEKFVASERSKAKVVRFPGGFLRLEGAQSPAKLASWAIPRVVMDEVDKYPRWSGREASPIELVKERTKNWPQRKIIVMSTPTTEAGNIYQAYINSEQRFKYYVPCPHCGEYQTLVFANVKFPKGKNGYDVALVEKEAYYQCAHCGEKIVDKYKRDMLIRGEWRAENEVDNPPKSVGFSLSSLYSPWVTFGEIAAKFVEVRDDPAKLMNFVNSWLGEPWRSKASVVETSTILGQRTSTPAGYIPKWAKLVTAGVDCQQGYFYWVVRAWGSHMTSQKVANGSCVTFSDLANIMDKWWPIEGSATQKVQIALYCVDSGYNTEDVYDYCYQNMDIAVPVKGSSHPLVGMYQRSSITPKVGRERPMSLYIADTDQYKNFIQARLNRGVDAPGAWTVDADTDMSYAEQLCAEHKVISEKGNQVVEHWEKITSARQNHYLDCEVYAAVAADIMNVRLITDDDNETADSEEKQQGFNPGTFSFK